MELKSKRNVYIGLILVVIIEPYWNWNGGRAQGVPAGAGYNWTLLELKSGDHDTAHDGYPVIIEPYWNWNSMKESISVKGLFVIIEPYWNWN